MIRWIWLSTSCLMLLLFACAQHGLRAMSIDQLREVRKEKEPPCFSEFYVCDSDGDNCQLSRTEYKAPDGTTRTWAACNTEYEAWLARLRESRLLLREKDPPPRCFKPTRDELQVFGVDPKDPDALITLAANGNNLGNPQCTAQWCAWMKRNWESEEPLPATCTTGPGSPP